MLVMVTGLICFLFLVTHLNFTLGALKTFVLLYSQSFISISIACKYWGGHARVNVLQLAEAFSRPQTTSPLTSMDSPDYENQLFK